MKIAITIESDDNDPTTLVSSLVSVLDEFTKIFTAYEPSTDNGITPPMTFQEYVKALASIGSKNYVKGQRPAFPLALQGFMHELAYAKAQAEKRCDEYGLNERER